jgi:hypothetical protein
MKYGSRSPKPPTGTGARKPAAKKPGASSAKASSMPKPPKGGKMTPYGK